MMIGFGIIGKDERIISDQQNGAGVSGSTKMNSTVIPILVPPVKYARI
jgi:hypothetical protein